MGNIISGILGILAALAIIVGFIYGYIANIVSLVTQNEATGMMIGRVIGIFVAPLGVVLGYF